MSIEERIVLVPKEEKTIITKEDVKKNYNLEVPKYIPLPVKKVNKLWYIIPIFNIIFSFIFFIICIAFGIWNAFTIIYIIFSIPLCFVSGITLFTRIFIDRKKINSKLKPMMYKNFIVANFLTSNKKIEEAIVPINEDGISFSIGKRDYIIDKDTIWYDDKKRPNSFYTPELPNPLKFMIEKTIKEYFDKLKLIKDNAEIMYNSVDNDIAFSSINLQQFKKDKIFSDLNRAEGTTDTKIVYILGAIIGALLFVMVLVVVLK